MLNCPASPSRVVTECAGGRESTSCGFSMVHIDWTGDGAAGQPAQQGPVCTGSIQKLGSVSFRLRSVRLVDVQIDADRAGGACFLPCSIEFDRAQGRFACWWVVTHRR